MNTRIPDATRRRPRGRGRPPASYWKVVNWSRPDAEIARQYNVTRQAVGYARRKYGRGVRRDPTPTEAFRAFVGEHKRKLHGLTVTAALDAAGLQLYIPTARKILRGAGIRMTRAALPSRLDGADWRLPDQDLARIWGVEESTASNRRSSHGLPTAQWDLRNPATRQDRGYRAAVRREERRATRALSFSLGIFSLSPVLRGEGRGEGH